MPPELITLAEAARRLAIHPGALRIQAERGRLRAFKVGRAWLIEPPEVERYRREVSKAGRSQRVSATDPEVSAAITHARANGIDGNIWVRPVPKPSKRKR